MADYNMDPNHLRTHEVNYELKIRGVSNTSADMAQKRKYLRRELQKDIARPGVHVYDTPDFSFETEKKDLDESLRTITTLVDDYDGTSKDVYTRAHSRLKHLRGRINRIPENISDDISGYRGDGLILVSNMEEELEEIKARHDQGESGRLSNASTSNVASSSKSFPVHKWNLTFDGTSTGGSVHSFLEQIEELSFARNVSEDELFRSAIELFEGPAKIWYRLIRQKVNSWSELVVALRKDFLPKDSDDDLWEVIRNRKQKHDERVIIFIAAMENLFSRLIIKAREAERLKIVRKNLLEAYHVHLALKDIQSIDQLAEICRLLEDAGIIREGPQRSHNSRRNVSSLEPDLAHLPTQNWYGNSNSMSELRCFGCNKPGHLKRNCQENVRVERRPNKREPSCFGCGKRGVIKPNCPRCSKNSRAGNGS